MSSLRPVLLACLLAVAASGAAAQDQRPPAQVEVMEALRDWAVGFAELNQHMAAWMGLPGSDANALGQIVWAAESGEPLSPARLARRLGMTSGATTILLNRLEGAGLIGRTREHADRRRVTLRPSETGRAPWPCGHRARRCRRALRGHAPRRRRPRGTG